ncbi:Alpha/Beta hydrolase protein [Lasiosphaeria miniovina]|uniref:Alpha/Beta hydrolase protein n=1 Tax=Lasiosphaeria miniovina TaxID=1954250 RepID=A0AA40B4B5_9PEZI|nr:Alpha/Beta hydrolase protein [Lasiosphaeria miniovina]KAK0727453.1 Alpha/Beta hydrolase protein [Lasiosphaeria miniovina]
MFKENPSLIQGPIADPRAGLETVGITSTDSPTPLVLIHDGGGTTFGYYCLGDLYRPVYGIANPHYGTDERWEGGIHEMASYYLKLIKTVIPPGSKVIIGGWSLGGLLSLEVSRLVLAEAGRRGALDLLGIIMIDSVCPLSLLSAGDVRVVLHVVEWNENTRQETRDAVMRCFSEAYRMLGAWKLPTWRDDGGQNGAGNGHNGTSPTTPSTTAGSLPPPPPPTILLRAQERVPVAEPGGVARVDVCRNDRQLGWDQHHRDLIKQVHDIPGHHYNIFSTDENLDAVTDMIKKACFELEAMRG